MGVWAPFGLKKTALKKSIKLTCFIVYLLLKSHKTCRFHRFFKCNFWARNVLISPFLIRLKCTNSNFTEFYHLVSFLTNVYTTFITFYHFLSPSANSYDLLQLSQLLYYFYLTEIDTKEYLTISPIFITISYINAIK